MAGPGKIPMMTKNVVEENIRKIRSLFPNCVTEALKNGQLKHVVDFDTLRQELSDHLVEGPTERFGFSWPDKRNSILLANTPTRKTLRPIRKESIDYDQTKNIYIEGDNLEALKIIREAYYGKVKMIYIDPPYNTGNDFIYRDNFKNTSEDYLRRASLTNEDGNKLISNAKTNGRFHSDWLNMIYPRLKVARDLLRDDGVIFISIDDNEQSHLKSICDEIFGEENFAAQFIWTKTSTPPSLSKTCRKTVEYILAYEKKKGSNSFYGSPLDGGDAPLLNKGNPIKTLEFPPGTINFNFIDQGILPQKSYDEISLTLENNIIVDHNKNKNKVLISAPFKWEQDTLNQEIRNGTTFIVKTNKLSIRFLRQNDDSKFKKPNNFLNRELDRFCGVGTNETGQKELKDLNIPGFSYPKPVSLISYLIRMVTNETKDGIILDFFSGSGTTAQSVIETNAKDGGCRQFILIQLDEKIDQENEATKAGFEFISDIGKERIRRCGSCFKNSGIDCGFRFFKIDESNMNEVFYSPKALIQANLFELTDNIKADRTPEDLLIQTMLSLGITLNCQYKYSRINNKNIFNVSNNFLIACFDDNLNDEVIIKIAKLHPIYAVFRNSCFPDDCVADNFEQIFKTYSPETTCKVI